MLWSQYPQLYYSVLAELELKTDAFFTIFSRIICSSNVLQLEIISNTYGKNKSGSGHYGSFHKFGLQANLDLRNPNLSFLNRTMFDLRKILVVNLKNGNRKKNVFRLICKLRFFLNQFQHGNTIKNHLQHHLWIDLYASFSKMGGILYNTVQLLKMCGSYSDAMSVTD